MSRLPILKSVRVFSLLLATTLPTMSAVPLPPAFSPSDRELISLAKTAAACTSPDDLPALTKSWNQFKDRAAKNPTKYTHIPGHWMTPIALLGTDELWKDYAAWFQKEFPGRIPVAALLPIARSSLKARLSLSSSQGRQRIQTKGEELSRKELGHFPELVLNDPTSLN